MALSEKPLTNLEFAQIAASISCEASAWARDILMPYQDGPARAESIVRFTKAIAERLERLERSPDT